VLRAGAPLLVETLHRDRLMKIFLSHSWEPLDGDSLVAEARRFDYVAGEIETDHIFVAGGARRDFKFRMRCYTATELVKMIADAGFGEIECFGDYEGADLSRETRLVVRARKPAQ
jgi:hypothetical protein